MLRQAYLQFAYDTMRKLALLSSTSASVDLAKHQNKIKFSVLVFRREISEDAFIACVFIFIWLLSKGIK